MNIRKMKGLKKMECKVEKTKNANEIKLEMTIEARKFGGAIQKVYFKKCKIFLIYLDLEKVKHQ